MLGVESVQFFLHQVRNSKVTAFSNSGTLFGTQYVKSKEHSVFLTSGEES